jgi:hypothetical protein
MDDHILRAIRIFYLRAMNVQQIIVQLPTNNLQDDIAQHISAKSSILRYSICKFVFLIKSYCHLLNEIKIKEIKIKSSLYLTMTEYNLQELSQLYT